MEKENPPQILSPSSSGRRRRSTDSPSPEFEFWMVRNPSFPQPDLVSADELFVDGILRPLHLLHHPEPPDPPKSSSDTPPNEPEPESEQPGLSEAPTVSKRWTDIFKRSSDRKNNGNEEKEKEKEMKREKKGGGGVNGVSSAELNINIWPFFRSRSAGSGGSRPRMAAANRKVSSAPCSRSNSAGESKSRRWPSSPSRGGVHVGRSSPVWQVRRGGGGSGGALGGRGSEAVVRNAEKGLKKEAKDTRRSKSTAVPSAIAGGAKGKVLNVPTCIGYRSHLSCRSDEIESSAVSVVSGGKGGAAGHSGGVGPGDGGRGNNNLFNLRGLFTKKVY